MPNCWCNLIHRRMHKVINDTDSTRGRLVSWLCNWCGRYWEEWTWAEVLVAEVAVVDIPVVGPWMSFEGKVSGFEPLKEGVTC